MIKHALINLSPEIWWYQSLALHAVQSSAVSGGIPDYHFCVDRTLAVAILLHVEVDLIACQVKG